MIRLHTNRKSAVTTTSNSYHTTTGAPSISTIANNYGRLLLWDGMVAQRPGRSVGRTLVRVMTTVNATSSQSTTTSRFHNQPVSYLLTANPALRKFRKQQKQYTNGTGVYIIERRNTNAIIMDKTGWRYWVRWDSRKVVKCCENRDRFFFPVYA